MQMYEALKAYNLPDAKGHFGPYGGVFVAETLMHALEELRTQYDSMRKDPAFVAEFEYELKHYVGRPSPVYHAKRLSEHCGGSNAKISTIPARTRSTTPSVRPCWRGAWARNASSRKPVPGSTAWHRPP